MGMRKSEEMPYIGPVLDGPFGELRFDNGEPRVIHAPSPLVELVLENRHFNDDALTVLPWGPVIDAMGEVQLNRVRYRWNADRSGWVLQSHTRVVYTWNDETRDWEPRTLDADTPNPNPVRT